MSFIQQGLPDLWLFPHDVALTGASRKAFCLVEGVKEGLVGNDDVRCLQALDATTDCGVATVFCVPETNCSAWRRGVHVRGSETFSGSEKSRPRLSLKQFLDAAIGSKTSKSKLEEHDEDLTPIELPVAVDILSYRNFIFRVLQHVYSEKVGEGSPRMSGIDALCKEPENQRHANWVTLYTLQTCNDTVFGVFGWTKHTLESMIKFNYHMLRPATIPTSRPPCLGEVNVTSADVISDVPLRFILFQLLQSIKDLHEAGLWHGDLRPSSIRITDDSWVVLEPPCLPSENQVGKRLTSLWCCGKISNLDYLMAVNAAAGRRLSDAHFHPVIPWITDFSSELLHDKNAAHWRDLRVSKFRLTKGDDQVDNTYRNSPSPHHITESLSEITYYIYMARRTPLTTLRTVVRSNFEAKEYPASMARMYEWTPDECIPEFFCDPDVYFSRHRDIDMPNLRLPDWCKTGDEFVKWHREALESEYVSQNLHHWIDLNFGYKLSGKAAIESKNVSLPLSSLPAHRFRKSPGFVQVFTEPHPQKRGGGNSFEGFEEMGCFETKFDHFLEPKYHRHGEIDEHVQDRFALGCIAAELYLREPLISLNDKGEAEMRLNLLPARMKSLVLDLLNGESSSIAELLRRNRVVFPSFFKAIYDFRSAYQLKSTWEQRLEFFRKEIEEIFEYVPSESKNEALTLIYPSLLQMMQHGGLVGKADLPVTLLKVLGRPNVHFALDSIVHLFEIAIIREDWDALSRVATSDSMLEIVRVVDLQEFQNRFVPILIDILSSATSPRTLKQSASKSVIALTKSSLFGLGLAVRNFLMPLLQRWSLKTSRKEIAEVQSVHLKQFFDQDGTLNEEALARVLNRLFQVLQMQDEHTVQLVLPVDHPLAAAVRFIIAGTGQTTITSILLPSLFEKLRKLWSSGAKELDHVAILDILSICTCTVSLLRETDIAKWFLKMPLMRQVLIDSRMLPDAHSLVAIYSAVLLAMTCTRAGLYDTTAVLEAAVEFFRTAFQDHSRKSIWVARIIYSALEVHWEPERLRNSCSAFLTPDLRKALVIPDAKQQEKPREPHQQNWSAQVYERTQSGDSNERTSSPRHGIVPPENEPHMVGDFCLEENTGQEVLLVEDRNESPVPVIAKNSVSEATTAAPKGSPDTSEPITPLSPAVADDIPSNSTFEKSRGDHALETTWILGPELSSPRHGNNPTISHSFQAHSSALVTLEVNEHETLMVTSSRASTVKLWSISDGPREIASFRNSRPVSSMRLVDLGRKCILLDGALQIWDTEHDFSALAKIKANMSNFQSLAIGATHRPVLSVEAAPRQASCNVLWVSTVAGSLDCLDRRDSKSVVSSFRLPLLAQATSRYAARDICASCICFGGSAGASWIAAARPSGHISVIDPRVGDVIRHWKAHESPVVRIDPISADEMTRNVELHDLLSISADGSARVWSMAKTEGFECFESRGLSWRPQCNLRIGNLPRVVRYSRVLAPPQDQSGTELSASSLPSDDDSPLHHKLTRLATAAGRSSSFDNLSGLEGMTHAADINVSRRPSLASFNAPDGLAASPVSNKSNSRRRAVTQRNGRLYISVPQCDTARLWRQDMLIMGGGNLLSINHLPFPSEPKDKLGQALVVHDALGNEVLKSALKINVLRILDAHGLVIVGAEDGFVHAVKDFSKKRR